MFAADKYKYPDDIFDDSRMSFGDHIEELRTRLIKALKGLVFCLLIGFVLDQVGEYTGYKNIGIGKPMLDVIKEPVEQQMRDFYSRRNERARGKIDASQGTEGYSADEKKAIDEKMKEYGFTSLTAEERRRLMGTPETINVVLEVEPLAKVFGPPKDPTVKEIPLKLQVFPAELNYLSIKGEGLLGNRQYLTVLSAQESMVVYFKVSLLCGAVIGSPWIIFQLWAFIAAGLYPHERRYVYTYFWPSVILFLFGVLLCQFVVLPGAVKALLGFSQWIDVDPELRLNEWLGFALILPLVFGVSFQTPLVMFVLNRLGIFSWSDYLARWRGAVMGLAVFSAVITPTPDVVTMLYLFVPMFGLYMAGVFVCWAYPPSHELEDAVEDASEIAV